MKTEKGRKDCMFYDGTKKNNPCQALKACYCKNEENCKFYKKRKDGGI